MGNHPLFCCSINSQIRLYIDKILETSKFVIKGFKASNPNYDAGDTRLVDVTVACIEHGRPEAYNFSDFELKKIETRKHLCIITARSYRDQADEMAHKLCGEMDVMPMYEHIYSSLASEEMGETLYMHIVDLSLGILGQHIAK